MISIKTFAALCFGALICTAQTINISGVVIGTDNSGISGVTVTLEEANLSTTTGADGKFSLINNPSESRPGSAIRTAVSGAVMVINGNVTFSLSENSPVGVSLHDVCGRQIYSNKRSFNSGTHIIRVPLQSAGIFLYMVTIGKDAYSFKSSPFGTLSAEHASVSRSTSLAKASAVIADVISAVKEGQLNYRDSIRASDTSGIIIKMIPNEGNVTDADGNVYQSVRIGNQVWTVENLKTTKYNDGTDISLVTDNVEWVELTDGAYCFYHNKSANKNKYGALYNWYAVNAGKLAPKGWKVPAEEDWDILENYLETNGYNGEGTTRENTIAKAMATRTGWFTNDYVGGIGYDLSRNNASGFSALPGGYRIIGGNFDLEGTLGCWWSTTKLPRSLDFRYPDLNSETYEKYYGFNVRLLQD